MGEWAAASGGGGGRLVAVDLLIFIRMLIFLTADFGQKSCAPKIEQESRYVQFLLARRESHQAPRSVTVPVLLLVGIVRVHFLYEICKYQIFSTHILLFGRGARSTTQGCICNWTSRGLFWREKTSSTRKTPTRRSAGKMYQIREAPPNSPR